MQLAFNAALERLGPFGPMPRLTLAVSGGADSTALALLSQNWAAANSGVVLALIVDHGLRASSAQEAELTQARLAERKIASRVITLSGLAAGAGLQERARRARHAALAEAAQAAGYVHLLLGHHARDQAETVAMRAARGPHGLEGIPAWSARNAILVLRPLLAIRPEMLRQFLRDENMSWVEDPSNADRRFERVRVRQTAPDVAADAAPRQQTDLETAAFLARHTTMRPDGFAVIHAEAAPAGALAALLRMIGGADYPPPRAAVAALAVKLRPATLGGVQITKAGRLGPGWLLAREPAACAPAIAARPGAIWDGRFRLTGPASAGAMLGAGDRPDKNLPALVRRGMPCLITADGQMQTAPALFAPPAPATSHPFIA